MGFNIGSWQFPRGVWAAPLQGITDDPVFRLLCRQHGAELTFVPMVDMASPDIQMFAHAPVERPFAVQVLGNARSPVKDCIEILESHGADIIDLNLSCPARNALVRDMGGALLRKAGKAAAFAEAVMKVTSLPVIAKMRCFWSREFNYGAQIAKELENCGVAALTVHGCSVKAKYTEQSNPKHIRAIWLAVRVPVVANGNIKTVADATQLRGETGAPGVMLGRACVGNPYIFQGFIEGHRRQPPLPADVRPAWLLFDYLQVAQEHQLPADLPRATHFLYMHLKDGPTKRVLREGLQSVKSLSDLKHYFLAKYPDLIKHPFRSF